MAQSVTILTSTTPPSPGVIVLNPVAKSTTVTLTSTTAAGSSNATVQIEMSLDDPSALGFTSATWTMLSSGTAMTASAAVSGLTYTVLSPIAQVRVNSTAGSTTTSYSFKLTALQSVTA